MAGRHSIEHVKAKAVRFCKDNDFGLTYEAEQELYPKGDLTELLIIQGVIFTFEEGQLKGVEKLGGPDTNAQAIVRAVAPEWVDKL